MFYRLDTENITHQIRRSVRSLQQITTELSEPFFKIGDNVPISKWDWASMKDYEPKFTQVSFEVATIASTTPSTNTYLAKQDERIRGKLYQNGIVTFN